MHLRFPLALALLAFTSIANAQAPAVATTREVLGVEDYARWRTVDGAPLSLTESGPHVSSTAAITRRR